MADIAIFRINYKSDFILTLNSDAGWMTPFCIKFWTGAPSKAYFAGWDGDTYTHCTYDPSEPTKLVVQFDDHHLPIGDLKFQIAYHFTVADFPNDVEDEVLNQSNIVTEIDGNAYQVMLDLNGETAPEIQFSLPAYANEAQRIANEEQRIAHEAIRIVNEESRIAAETIRQQNEAHRIAQETARVNEFATLKAQSQAATSAANTAAALANEKAQLAADKAAFAQAAATLANQKAQLAADKAALANAAAQLANEKAALAQQKAEYAQQQGGYAKDQGDYAKNQGDYAKDQGDTALADHQRAEADHGIAVDDHTQAGNDHTRAESDHGIAVDDHTQAGNDHTRAESDHGIAVDDHTQAGNDHTCAEADHGIAVDDHTQAGNDHTRAESDHTRAESDHAAVEVYVDSLGAFDISAYNATGGVLAKYADLTAALGTNGANIPDVLCKGGMSVKFVRSSDNKYVQCRYMSSSTADADFTNVANWQGVDAEPTAGSENLVESGPVYDKTGGITSYTITSFGYSHSSNDDRLPIFIPANTIIKLKLENADSSNPANPTNLSVYVLYEGEETTTELSYISINGWLVLFTPKNVISIGFYYTKIAGVNSVKVTLDVPTVREDSRKWKEVSLENSFYGQGSTYSRTNIELIKGNKYAIYLKNINWERSHIGSDITVSLFDINSIGDNDVSTLLKQVQIRDASSLNSVYTFTVPPDSKYIRVGGRADIGEEVQFILVDITAVTSLESEINTAKEDISNIKYAIDYNELSQLNLFAGTIYRDNYPAASNNCLCSTFYYRVTPSSILRIQRASDIKIRIIQYGENKNYLRQNETYSNIDSVTLGSDTHFVRISANYSERGYSAENPITIGDFVEGDFGLYLGQANFVSLTENLTEEDKEKAQSNLGLNAEEILDFNSNNLLKNKIITEQLLNNYFVGKGNTYNKTKIVGLTSGNTYRVCFKETPWDMTGVTATGVNKFSVTSWYNNVGTDIIAVHIAIANLEPYYDFTVPENSDYITIGGRAANNALVRFTILDVTDILNIECVDFPDDIRDFTFNVRQGVAHDASSEKISTVIKKSSTMTVTVETTCVSVFNNFVVWYDDGTSANAAGTVYRIDSETHVYTFDFVTPKNIIQIGVGASANDISSTGTVNATLHIINALEKEINSIGEKLSFIEPQSLTDEQKEIAKGNLGLIGNLSVKDLNSDIHNVLVSAKSQENKYPTLPQNAMLAFLVATDIHSDWNHLQRAVEYVNDESSLIDGLLVLGDICENPVNLRYYDYANLMLQCTNPVLTIPGNHEVATSTPLTNNEMMSEFYSAEMVAKNGDIHPEGKLYWYRDISHDYYYRDYDADNYNAVGTHTIRIIGLCQADYCASEQKNDWYFSQEQIDWLVNVLDNTPVDTYVLILTHSTIEDDNNLTAVDNKFTGPYPASSYTTLSNKSFITDIIRAWINGTTINESSANTIDDVVLSVNHDFSTPRNNKFVGFLSGHSHRDHVARINGTEAIYQINLHCTTSNLWQQSGDVGRETSGKLQDCLTIFVYDWFKHRIKLIRVGADITTEMKLRDFDIIDLV